MGACGGARSMEGHGILSAQAAVVPDVVIFGMVLGGKNYGESTVATKAAGVFGGTSRSSGKGPGQLTVVAEARGMHVWLQGLVVYVLTVADRKHMCSGKGQCLNNTFHSWFDQLIPT